MLTCRACGATAPDDARFCPTCGNALPALPVAPASPPPEGEAAMPPAPTAWGPPPPYPPAPGLPGLPGPGPRPLGVLLVALWNMGIGVLVVLAGMAIATVGPAVFADPALRAELEREAGGALPGFFAEALVFLGLFAVLFGAAMVVVGWGLYQARPWAWTGMVVLILANALFNVLSFPVGLVGLLVNAFLLWYFLQPGVKRFFGKEEPAAPGLPGYVPPPT